MHFDPQVFSINNGIGICEQWNTIRARVVAIRFGTGAPSFVLRFNPFCPILVGNNGRCPVPCRAMPVHTTNDQPRAPLSRTHTKRSHAKMIHRYGALYWVFAKSWFMPRISSLLLQSFISLEIFVAKL